MALTEEQYQDWRRAEHKRSARLATLDLMDRDIIRVANTPGFPRWVEQIKATGGCARPVYLRGSTITTDRTTGAVLSSYSTATEPGGRLAVRCRNRRASRCPSCAWQHQGDTYHLVRAGITGGKGIPHEVVDQPAVFATLTAPSFGAVHRATTGADRCRPRRDAGTCEHGTSAGCPGRHRDGDRIVGQPICPACYDYTGHVLWNAHVGALWDTFATTLRRRLAAHAGIPRSRLRDHLTVSYSKVAEYQARGAVHVHAVIRLDGADGPGTEPPTWATAELLARLVLDAAAAVRVHPPQTEQLGSPVLTWGSQVDVRPLRTAPGGADGLTDDAVASYLAKYVTKSVTDSAGAADTRITSRAEIDRSGGADHTRALMRTAWDLGGIPELAHLRLRAWAHMLGFRGHVLTKSRTYSTTYYELRAARRTWRTAGQQTAPPNIDTVTVATWTYAGTGHTPGEAEIAATIAHDLALSRELAREEQMPRRRVG